MFDESKVNQKAKVAQDALSDFINGSYDDGEEDFITLLKRDHRTLQQKQIKLFLKAIEAFAEIPDNRTDLRNEDAVKISRKIVEKFKEDHDGYKPSQFIGYV